MKILKRLFILSASVVMSLCMAICVEASTAGTVKLNEKQVTVYAGGNYTVKMTGTAKKVKWTSSNKSVATVTNGKVLTKKAGTAVITVSSGTKKATCRFVVKKALSANQIASKINSQVKKANNITSYSTDISDKSVTTYAINFTNGIMYLSSSKNNSKFYFYKNKTYWYSKTDKKWYYEPESILTISKIDREIPSGAACRLKGFATISGKKCVKLEVGDSSLKKYYFVDAVNYNVIALKYGNFSTKVDMKTVVTIPKSVLKATQKEYTE